MDDPSVPASPAPSPAERRERILDALGDPAARGILLMLNESAHSAQELLQSNHIPQSTLYRKLHDLQQLGLVGIQRTAITAEGKRVDLYRSLLEELKVDLAGGTLRIQVRFRDLSSERLKDMWHQVRSEVRP
ncbi:MAG TPA: helix-turn-helix domain-containing protein [Thermoplasmata archaeon]|nr:helix-turn-helix domain-containing protein [Thermoplasmata archaeon]